MPRPLPSLPSPEAVMVKPDRKPDREWFLFLSNLIAALLNRVPVTGSATFAAATTVAVAFATPEANDDYDVFVSPAANRTYWASSKTVNGFTLNASASNSDTVRWALIRA